MNIINIIKVLSVSDGSHVSKKLGTEAEMDAGRSEKPEISLPWP